MSHTEDWTILSTGYLSQQINSMLQKLIKRKVDPPVLTDQAVVDSLGIHHWSLLLTFITYAA